MDIVAASVVFLRLRKCFIINESYARVGKEYHMLLLNKFGGSHDYCTLYFLLVSWIISWIISQRSQGSVKCNMPISLNTIIPRRQTRLLLTKVEIKSITK